MRPSVASELARKQRAAVQADSSYAQYMNRFPSSVGNRSTLQAALTVGYESGRVCGKHPKRRHTRR